MKYLKNISLSLAAILVAVLLTGSLPALAHQGRGGGDDDSIASSSTDSDNSGSGSGSEQESEPSHHESENENETEDEQPELTAENVSSARHHRGENLLRELRKEHKSLRSPAQVKKQCQTRKHGLARKFDRILTNSQRIQTRIDNILNLAQTYQQGANLAVDNYDSLLAAAQSAQTTSANAISNLSSLRPSLDCNNVSVASDVAAFKEAAIDTRSQLKAYRGAVKDLVQALIKAKGTTTDIETERSN